MEVSNLVFVSAFGVYLAAYVFFFFYILYNASYYCEDHPLRTILKSEKGLHRKSFHTASYIVNIYARPVLQALDFSTDLASAVVYLSYNREDAHMHNLGYVSIGIIILYRVFSSAIIFTRFPNMENRYAVLILQFFDFEVIRQTALSHADGYQHFFYIYIKQSEAILEGAFQALVTLYSLLAPEYYDTLSQDRSDLMLIIVSFALSLLVVIFTISDTDKSAFREARMRKYSDSKLKYKYRGCKIGTLQRFGVRFFELTNSFVLWIWFIHVSFWFGLSVLIICIIIEMYLFLLPDAINVDTIIPDEKVDATDVERMKEKLCELAEDYPRIDATLFFNNDILNFVTFLFMLPNWFTISVFRTKDNAVSQMTFLAPYKSKFMRIQNVIPWPKVHPHVFQRISKKGNLHFDMKSELRNNFLHFVYFIRFLFQLLVLACSIVIGIFVGASMPLMIFIICWFFFSWLMHTIGFYGLAKNLDGHFSGSGGFNEYLARKTKNANMMRELIHLGVGRLDTEVESTSLAFELLYRTDRGQDVDWVLSHTDFDINECNSHGSALNGASARGNLDTVKALLKHSANTETVDSKKRTPLMCSADPEVIKMLLEHGASVNAKDKRGISALMHSTRFTHSTNPHAFELDQASHLSALRILIEHKADIHEMDSNGRDVLSHATEYGFSDRLCIVKYLVECGAHINKQSKRKAYMPPAAHAVQWGHAETLRYLIDQKADVNWKSKKGKSLLSIERKRESKEVEEILALHGLTPPKSD